MIAFATVALATWPAAAIQAAVGDESGDGDSGSDPTVDTDGEIVAVVSGSDFVFTEGGSGSGPKCTWKHLTTGQYENKLSTNVNIVLEPLPEVPDLPTDREPTPEEVEARDRAVEEREATKRRNNAVLAAERARRRKPSLVTATRNGVTGKFRVFTAVCPDRALGLIFIPPRLDTNETISRAVDYLREQIPDATPAINPAVDVGGVVNIGMWLAVEPQPSLGPVTAEAGPDSWVTVTARHNATSFDMGNGDVVTCEGHGDAIPTSELDNPDESPICGYTYQQSSFDDAPYSLGIDALWSIPWDSSSGPGSLTYAQRSALPYDVDEIQTVGSR